MNRANLLEWAKKYCNNPSLTDSGDFAMVLDKMEKVLESSGVASESLGDYSVTFDKNSALGMKQLLSPYKRLKML